MLEFAALVLLGSLADSLEVHLPDLDRDGIGDLLEDRLLEKFVPRFYLSATDCDGMPAEFTAGEKHPIVKEKNGTLYGQATPVEFPTRPGRFFELHFFHLWSRDCGRGGHDLDAEHVSALIEYQAKAPAPDNWTALYWYAAAHEGTICDVSHAARADSIAAEASGPPVWLSQGKHASFLSARLCRGGCGGDECEQMTRLEPPQIINLGEPARLMVNAQWVASDRWPLVGKLRSDFSEELLDRIDEVDGPAIVSVGRSVGTVRAMVLAGDSTLGALEASTRETGEALGTVHGETRGALGAAAVKTGRSVGKAVRAVWRFLGGKD